MAPLSSIQFVDAALNSTGPFKLAYSDPNQKWMIRKDLLALLQDFPTFSPSMETFTHNDGTSVNLLNASGNLRISNSAPFVPLLIWLHEGYPSVGPMVFVKLDPGSQIQRDHPFVDRSGLAWPPYLNTWSHPRNNLCDLVRHLVRLFSKDHPLIDKPPLSATGFTHPSLVSKMEAIDRISGMAYYDMVALRSGADQEVEDLLKLQEEMRARSELTSTVMAELELEKMDLKGKVRGLNREVERLKQWLDDHEAKGVALANNCGDIETVESAFEAVDERSRILMDCSTSDLAIEDTIYALDEAVQMGIMNINDYIKQVRSLAREQFKHIARRVELEGLQQHRALPWSFFIFKDGAETAARIEWNLESLDI